MRARNGTFTRVSRIPSRDDAMTQAFPLLDRLDRRILACLQENARISHVELSERVNLSASQCQRRVKRLEDSGVIEGYGARVSAEAVGLGLTAFVSVTLGKHGENPAARFAEAIRLIPDILECHAVTGEADYLLRVSAPDLKAFSTFLLHRLMSLPGVAAVKSSVALEPIKTATGLPLTDDGA